MIKKLFFLITLLLVSCNQDDNVSVQGDCDCSKEIYSYELVSMSGTTPVWGYVYSHSVYAPEFDCDDSNDEYIFMGDNLYFKIKCD